MLNLNKRNLEKSNVLRSLNGKKLHLDKKQNGIVFPSITSNEKNHHQEGILKLLQRKSIKSISIRQNSKTIPTCLFKKIDENTKDENKLSRNRLFSESILRKCQKDQKNQQISKKKTQTKLNLRSKSVKRTFESTQQRNKKLNQTIFDNSSVNQTHKKQQQFQLTNLLQNFNQKLQNFNQKQYNENIINFSDKINNKAIQKTEIYTEKKSFQSIGISTDLQFNGDTFKQFIKYRITQKQKYSKMQQIFDYIENLSTNQKRLFDQRSNKIKNIYQKQQLSPRQKNIDELIKNQTYNQITMQKQIKQSSQKQLQFLNREFNKFQLILNKLKSYFSNTFDNETHKKQNRKKQSIESISLNKLFIFQNIQKNYKSTQQNKQTSHQDNKLNDCEVFFKTLDQKINALKEQLKQKIDSNSQQLSRRFQIWQQGVKLKNYQIKNCIDEIIKLPEMSLAIFGMSDEGHDKQNVQMLKKIGIFLQQVPQMEKFYSKNKSKYSYDTVFNELIDFKCLNCTYLKSKMRYIYNKNNQLKCVLKILKKLTNQYQTKIL